MNRWIRYLLLLALCFSPLTLAGCWDRVEVNDIAIAVASAVDKEKDGKIRMSIQIPLVSQFGGKSGGGGDAKNFIVDTGIGSTVREANAKQQLKLSRRLFFAHRRVLLVSDEVAKDQGIRDFFDVIARTPENRLHANFAIVKGKAYKLLTTKSRLEKYSGEGMRELLESENILGTTMKDVAQMLNQHGVDALIPYIGLTEANEQIQGAKEEFKMYGYAMFRDDKMVGVLREEDSDGVRWLRQDFKPYGKTFDFGGGKISLNVYKGQAQVTPVLLPDHIRFDVKVQATAYMMESTAPIDFVRPEQVEQLETKLAAELRDSIDKSIAIIKDTQSDVGNLGVLVARTYPRKWQMEYLPRWREELKKAEFTSDIQVKISRVGLTSDNIAEKVRR